MRRTRDQDRAAVGQWIKAQREAKGWTQKELADKYGVTQAAISLLEQGRRALAHDRLLDLCALFGVDPTAAMAAIEVLAAER